MAWILLRSPRNQLKSPRFLQKFIFRDGFISPEIDATLAFGVPGLDLESFAGTLEVCLCKKDRDDLSKCIKVLLSLSILLNVVQFPMSQLKDGIFGRMVQYDHCAIVLQDLPCAYHLFQVVKSVPQRAIY